MQNRNHIKDVINLILLVGISLGVLYPVLSVGFIVLDDAHYVTANLMVLKGLSLESISWAFSTLYYGNWSPLTWIYHMFDVEFFGLDPFGHHLSALVLHILNSLLFYFLLRRFAVSHFSSFLAALIFAIHPQHVEVISWVSSHKDVLSGLFFFLTLHAYFSYSRKGGQLYYILCLLFFALGLMAKSSIVTIPVVLLLIDYWPLKKDFSAKKTYIEKTPFLLLAGAFVFLTSYAQEILGATSYNFLSLERRIANAFYYIYQYLYNFFLPLEISIQYPHPFDQLPVTKLILCFLLVLLLSAYFLLKRIKSPQLLVSWSLFLFLISPYLQIVQVGNQAMSDRWMYLPLMGVAMIVAFSFEKLQTSCRYILSFAMILYFGAFTLVTLDYWNIPGEIFRKGAERHEANDLAYLYAGMTDQRSGDLISARENYSLALDFNPNNELAFQRLANLMEPPQQQQLLLRLANILSIDGVTTAASIKRGKILQTIAGHPYLKGLFEDKFKRDPLDISVLYFRKALAEDPENGFIHSALADVYLALKKENIAEQHYLLSLRYGPNSASILNAAGAYYLSKGSFSQAKSFLERGVSLNPNSVELHVNLGYLYLLKNQIRNSKEHYLAGIELIKATHDTSVQAYIGLAEIYMKEKNYVRARLVLNESLSKSPNNPKVLNTMAGVYFVEKEYGEALAILDYLIESEDIFDFLSKELQVSILFNRSLLLKKIMRFNEVRENLHWLLSIDPDNFTAMKLLREIEASMQSE